MFKNKSLYSWEKEGGKKRKNHPSAELGLKQLF
jgi:hypothetical protein